MLAGFPGLAASANLKELYSVLHTNTQHHVRGWPLTCTLDTHFHPALELNPHFLHFLQDKS